MENQPDQSDIRLCFVGDSFVNGIGDPEYLGWPGRLCRSIPRGPGITYYNLGVRGDTSATIAQRWKFEVSSRLSGVAHGRIIFSFGTNDATVEVGQRRVMLTDTVKYTRQILRDAKFLFPTLMVGPAPIADDPVQNDRIHEVCRAIEAVCHEVKVPYLDIFTPLLESQLWQQEALQNDGAHPGAEGYRFLADLVRNWSAWKDWFV